MATKFSDYIAAIDRKQPVYARLQIFKDPLSNDLYVEEKTPGAGTDVNVTNLPIGPEASADSVSITFATDISLPHTERTSANAPLSKDYSVFNLTTAVYTELVAATTAKATKIHVFDSSGFGWLLAFGGVGVEADQIIIPPGGDNFEILIPAGTRLSAKPLGATINLGLLQMSFLS